MTIPLTREEELKRHKYFMIHQSKKRSIEKKVRDRDNKIERFCAYTSHNLKEFIEPSNFQFVNKIIFKKDLNKNYNQIHELKKVEIACKLYLEGNDVIIEPTLKDKSIGRPDILLLNKIPAEAYEIICSEKESSILNKDIKYPFKIITARGD